jgi:hypothetical protein
MSHTPSVSVHKASKHRYIVVYKDDKAKAKATLPSPSPPRRRQGFGGALGAYLALGSLPPRRRRPSALRRRRRRRAGMHSLPARCRSIGYMEHAYWLSSVEPCLDCYDVVVKA